MEEVKEELGLGTKELRAVRTGLERVGAVVASDLRVETTAGGHRHTSELFRWDQLFPRPSGVPGGLEELLAAGVAAAVVAPEHEVRTWFSWRAPTSIVDSLVEAGRVLRHPTGVLSAAGTASAPAPGARSRSPRPG